MHIVSILKDKFVSEVPTAEQFMKMISADTNNIAKEDSSILRFRIGERRLATNLRGFSLREYFIPVLNTMATDYHDQDRVQGEFKYQISDVKATIWTLIDDMNININDIPLVVYVSHWPFYGTTPCRVSSVTTEVITINDTVVLEKTVMLEELDASKVCDVSEAASIIAPKIEQYHHGSPNGAVALTEWYDLLRNASLGSDKTCVVEFDLFKEYADHAPIHANCLYLWDKQNMAFIPGPTKEFTFDASQLLHTIIKSYNSLNGIVENTGRWPIATMFTDRLDGVEVLVVTGIDCHISCIDGIGMPKATVVFTPIEYAFRGND